MEARIAIVDDEITVGRRLQHASGGVVRVEDQPRTILWSKIKEQEFMKDSSQYHCFTCHTKIPF